VSPRVDERKAELDVLEVAAVLLVDEDQVEVVARRELLVDVAERRRELEPAQEQPDRDRLACARERVREESAKRLRGEQG